MSEMIDSKNQNRSELEIIKSKQCISNSSIINETQCQNIYDELFFKPIGDIQGKYRYSKEIDYLDTPELIQHNK